MICHKLLLCIMVIAYFLAQADAEPGDPLSPSLLGESMSMPLPVELIQNARNAGVITGSSSLSEPDSQQSSFSVAPQMEVDADSSMDRVNVTGAWSFNLKGKDHEQIKLYLVQNDSMVKGQGVITRKNETDNATASGSITGDKINLDVMSAGASNLYRLNLSLSSLAKGYYTAYLADGSNQSGQVTFSVSSNIFKDASLVNEDEEMPDA